MGKHAYCILAHNEPDIFAKLISAIDHPLNDIFVHIDKRNEIGIFQKVQSKYSRIIFLKNRIACNWGSLSIVKAELNLFDEAYKSGPYAYYHLLSGVDLPLKRQTAIHHFFDSIPDKNLIGFFTLRDENENECSKYFHLLVYRPGGNLWRRTCNRIDWYGQIIQNKLGIRVHFPFPLYKGAQWVSLSQGFLAWLVGQREKILKTFRYTFVPDERFIQSFFMASPYKDSLYLPNADEYQQCMREIDWERGKPYTWRNEDFDYLVTSEKLFARKFSSSDMEIVNRLIDRLR